MTHEELVEVIKDLLLEFNSPRVDLSLAYSERRKQQVDAIKKAKDVLQRWESEPPPPGLTPELVKAVQAKDIFGLAHELNLTVWVTIHEEIVVTDHTTGLSVTETDPRNWKRDAYS